MRRGGHLNFVIPHGDHKNFTHATGGSLKFAKLLKFPEPPLQVKNDTSLSTVRLGLRSEEGDRHTWLNDPFQSV